MVYKALLAAALLMATPHLALTATDHPASAASEKAAQPPDKEAVTSKPPKKSVTKHSIAIAGKPLSYTATAAEMPLQNDSGEPEAKMFYIAYTANPAPGAGPRPLLFIFNGGPGAASVWLHLGALGPRRVELLPDGRMPKPPFRLVDNAWSWLDLGDLVFIDPVGTGYSRAAKPDQAKNFASVRGDIDSVAKFIRLYLTLNDRWSSPLFLVGESYGTFRAAGLSEHLLEHGVAPSGIVLISTVLNMQTLHFDNGNELPYQLFLPSYTATAWYHGKLAPDLQRDLNQTLAEVEQWSSTDYLLALNQGDRLTPAQRQAVAEKLSRYTGLPAKFIFERNLRIDSRTFLRELLRDRGQMLGYMDSRFSADNVEPSAPSTFDPTIAGIKPPFTSAFLDYVRKELKYDSELEYFTLGGGIPPWDWDAKNSYADTSDNLRNSMARDPYLKVFVASGLFDLATPHLAAEYTLNHLGLPDRLRGNITEKRYEAGHMMYLDKKSLEKLKEDAKEFFGNVTKQQ